MWIGLPLHLLTHPKCLYPDPWADPKSRSTFFRMVSYSLSFIMEYWSAELLLSSGSRPLLTQEETPYKLVQKADVPLGSPA